MEEIVTVDGRQYKLTYDQPLTAQQKAQAMADIKKQSCRTCGTKAARPRYSGTVATRRRTATLGLPGTPLLCTDAIKNVNTDPNVILEAAPMVGTAPYIVEFFINPVGNDGNTEDDASESIPVGRIPGTYTDYDLGPDQEVTDNPQTNVAEATAADVPTISVTYTLTDDDISDRARERVEEEGPSILYRVSVTDSCAVGAGGPKTCSEYCKVFVECPVPTCNFIVS